MSRASVTDPRLRVRNTISPDVKLKTEKMGPKGERDPWCDDWSNDDGPPSRNAPLVVPARVPYVEPLAAGDGATNQPSATGIIYPRQLLFGAVTDATV